MRYCEGKCLCAECRKIIRNCAECQESIDRTKECVTTGIRECKYFEKKAEQK